MSFLEENCKKIENQGSLIFCYIGDSEMNNFFESPVPQPSDLFFSVMSVVLVCISSFQYLVEKSSEPLQSRKVATNELLVSRQILFRQ